MKAILKKEQLKLIIATLRLLRGQVVKDFEGDEVVIVNKSLLEEVIKQLEEVQ